MHSDRTPSKSIRTIAAVALVLIACSAAEANPGAAIVFRTAGYLIIGNAIITLIEFLVARKATRLRKHAGSLLLAANYLSAWAGVMLVAYTDPAQLFLQPRADPINATLTSSFITIALLAIITIVVEWGFFWLAVGSGDHRARRVARAFLLAHLVSYSALLLYYLPSINIRLLTDYRLVSNPSEVIASDNAPWVYYIGADNRSVWRIRADGSDGQHVADTDTDDPWTIIALEKPDGRFALAALGFEAHTDVDDRLPGDRDAWLPPHTLIVPDIGQAASIFLQRPSQMLGGSDDWNRLEQIRARELAPYVDPGDAADLRPRGTRTQSFWWYGHYTDSLMMGTRNDKGRSIGCYTGFSRRGCAHSSISVLPGDDLVWEIAYTADLWYKMKPDDPRAIYVMSNEHKRIARLALGRSPIVAYEVAPEGWVNPLARFDVAPQEGRVDP